MSHITGAGSAAGAAAGAAAASAASAAAPVFTTTFLVVAAMAAAEAAATPAAAPAADPAPVMWLMFFSKLDDPSPTCLCWPGTARVAARAARAALATRVL